MHSYGVCMAFGILSAYWGLLKLGRRGCLIAAGSERFHVPAYAVPVVDSIGAGDAFAAGFLWARSQGAGLRDCGEAGAAAVNENAQQVPKLP